MTKMYESNNHILILAGYSDPGEHSHKAAHLMVSLGQEMTVRSDEQEFICRGVLIPSGTAHSVDTHGSPTLVFLYDSTTRVAARIKCVQTLPEPVCDEIRGLFAEFEKDGSYPRFEKELLSILGFQPGCSVTDQRIISAMNSIRSGLSEPLTCRDAAASVFLSESRFSHLFREQVGMTFAAYRIYQRLLNVYTQILKGRSITEAALEAGFSSSAHFAEVNRRVFGLSAGSITKDLVFTKV